MTTEDWLESFNGPIEAAKHDATPIGSAYAKDVPDLIQEVRFWRGLAIRTAYKVLMRETKHE